MGTSMMLGALKIDFGSAVQLYHTRPFFNGHLKQEHSGTKSS